MIRHWKAATPAAAGAAALLAAAVALLPGRLWPTLGQLIVGHWLVLLLAVAGVTGLTVGGVLWRRSQPAAEASAAPAPPQRPLRPLPSWLLGLGFLAVAGITWAAVWGLQSTIPAGVGSPLEQAQLRVETIRTGLSVGAGVGAAAALLLALRRQQVTERTQQATEYDAGEKRVTELYVKAAEQLGSDKAPVRLAGLYALERLAQDNPAHQQSIVDVICAYLRMPYTPPAEKQTPKPDQPTQPDPREERQVRLEAQRILARHLRPKTLDGSPGSGYWNGVTLDLTEATLLDADFTNCILHARFDNAFFVGEAGFDNATFANSACFDNARFSGKAFFIGSIIVGFGHFDGVYFGEGVSFSGVTCKGGITLTAATVRGIADFDKEMFARNSFLDGAKFEGGVYLDDHITESVDSFTHLRPLATRFQIDLINGRVVHVLSEEKLEGDAESE
ncbi:pentapeptide repeat-containing protein [Solwaraspora sp. WMMD937]|uniref:pentapeptide repeat-containing protein n=1 Tax=Solwaraspora sp. WMMD937 TaxID=3016090 RepID=UPI00249A6AAA|nr:pentapeptide repeat-containing protein [Solwaraspora sp. WMMD937]WFE20289.1 pentapeptide repeat-containing protein [Solwaraspora sp. WMMD937]